MQYRDNDFELHHTLTESPDEACYPLHMHKHCEIFCFLNGQGYYTVEGRDYPLSPGTILIMRDGETHKLHIASDRPYERLSLHFSPSILPESARATMLAAFHDRPWGCDNRLPPSPYSDRVRNMLLRITEEDIPADEVRRYIVSYLPAILLELRAAAVQPHEVIEDEQVPAKDNHTLVERMISFINGDPGSIADMESLEEHFGFSRSYLNRIFRRSTGVSIWDYVILKRLMLAREAIRAGHSAMDAAATAGYQDYSAFYRQYRKRFGITPEDEKRSMHRTERRQKHGDISNETI